MSDTATRVAGVDAGGSHTAAVVTDASLHVLGRADGPAGIVRPGALEASADAIMTAIGGALRGAGEASLTACVVGAAGAGDAPVQTALADALRARGAPAATVVTTDADVAFAGALPDGPGILLLAGTGSIALARDAAGVRHRVGGRGWLVGDEGSGFALGRAGVAAVVRALDGRGPATTLSQALPQALDLTGTADLVRWAGQAGPQDLAALGAAVQRAAAAGDAVALGLLDAAAEDLVAHVVALRPHFAGGDAIPVVLAGGALVRGRPLRRRVETLLGARARWATIRDVAVDPAEGAARLAVRLGVGVPRAR